MTAGPNRSEAVAARAGHQRAADGHDAQRRDFFGVIERLVDGVYRDNPRIPDRRAEYPWVTGHLGDPFAPVWFIAEAPSLSRIEGAHGRTGVMPTPEMQWTISPGDKLFREMLAKHSFKTGGAFSPGGWRCYITGVGIRVRVVCAARLPQRPHP